MILPLAFFSIVTFFFLLEKQYATVGSAEDSFFETIPSQYIDSHSKKVKNKSDSILLCLCLRDCVHRRKGTAVPTTHASIAPCRLAAAFY